MAKVYDNATDLITFARSSSGTALRRVGYGPELVVDDSGNWVGDFAAGDLTGWEVSGSDATHSVTYSSGGARYQSDTTSPVLNFKQSNILEVGKLYQITVETTAYTSGSLKTDSFLGTKTLSDGLGTVTINAVARIPTLGILRNSTNVDITIDNVSVKEVIFDRATDDLVLFNHPDDIPRIEYGSDGSLKGLLIEEQRTNLITRSQSLTLGVDSMFKSPDDIVTNSAGTFLDGSNDAVYIDFGLPSYCGVQKAITSGKTYTFSFFVKPINVPGDWFIAVFPAQGGSGFQKNIAADLVTDEWVRVHLTFTAAATTTHQLRFVNNVEVEAYICGFQLEEGSFPTSYIPTSGSQVTRWADVASIPVSAFGYNQDAGTVVVEFDTVSASAGYIGDQSLATSVAYSSVRDFKTFNGTSTTTTSNTFTLGQPAKGVVAYDNGERAVCLNGGAVASNSGLMQPVTEYKFGQAFGGNYLNGHIKSLSYFPRRLTDAQLQSLTE